MDKTVLHHVIDHPMAVAQNETWAILLHWDHNDFTDKWQACYYVRDGDSWYNQLTGEVVDWLELGCPITFAEVNKLVDRHMNEK